jgi:hypothetical protein
MSYEKDLLTGIAQMISDSSIAVYRPVGAYDPAENAIVFGDYPTSPDQCVVLNYTPVTDATMIPMGRGILEVHCRGAQGDPFGATEPAVAIFELLHGMRNQPFGTANVIQLLRDHTAPLEQDTSRRSKRVDIYFVDVDAPPTANRPDGGEW